MTVAAREPSLKPPELWYTCTWQKEGKPVDEAELLKPDIRPPKRLFVILGGFDLRRSLEWLPYRVLRWELFARYALPKGNSPVEDRVVRRNALQQRLALRNPPSSEVEEAELPVSSHQPAPTDPNAELLDQSSSEVGEANLPASPHQPAPTDPNAELLNPPSSEVVEEAELPVSPHQPAPTDPNAELLNPPSSEAEEANLPASPHQPAPTDPNPALTAVSQEGGSMPNVLGRPTGSRANLHRPPPLGEGYPPVFLNPPAPLKPNAALGNWITPVGNCSLRLILIASVVAALAILIHAASPNPTTVATIA